MRLIYILIVLFGFICSLFSIEASAAPLPFGWYIEGNVGVSNISNTNFGPGVSTSNSGNSIGYNVNAGYKFIPYFAAEAGYTKYSKINITGPLGLSSGTAQPYALDLAAKAIWPISDLGFELFTKVGVDQVRLSVSGANISNSKSNNSGGLYLGIGAEGSCSPNIPINIQWARAQGNSTAGNLNLYSVGIGYIFD